MGCTDPAVRVASCLKTDANKLDSLNHNDGSFDCSVNLDGRYSVVLHPAKELSDDDLARAGVSEPIIQRLRKMRSVGEYEMVLVFPTDKQGPPSFTTYQKHSVVIPELLVANKNDDSLSIVLSKTPEGITVKGIN